MSKLLAFIFAFIAAHPAHANIEIPADWDQVRLVADVEGEKVVLSITVERNTLTSLIVTIRGQDVRVPKSELAGLPAHLALRTVRVLAVNPRSPPGPPLRVIIDSLPHGYGHEPAARVQFLFSGPTYQGWKVDFLRDDRVLRSEIKTPEEPVQQQK